MTETPQIPAVDHSDQAEVIAFLGRPAAHTGACEVVDRHETHGALVFLAGERAYKIKRAVTYDYMDFSTLDRRRQMLEREVAINRLHAPDLYLRVVAITRAKDGRLSIGGDGTPVEYALEMRRFDQSDLLSAMASRNRLTTDHAIALADEIFNGHRRMLVRFAMDGDARMVATIDAVSRQLVDLESIFQPLRLEAFRAHAMQQLHRARDCLRARGESGFVRRCHGDLHLGNIVMLVGRLTPFDALEFDDEVATIDTLYDLAFLLMDLEHAKERRIANAVFNRYLWRSAAPIDIKALVAMPLFLGLRSAIRAMTRAQRAVLTGQGADAEAARSYFGAALRHLEPAAPRLVAVGGYSGTGKSTLAAELAFRLGPAPGAVHIRSDLERKSLFYASPTDRLAADCYTPAATARVYAIAMDKARLALAAGHSVVVDAAFLDAGERAAMDALAGSAGCPFAGLWLTAPRERLIERVAARKGDASDATPAIVDMQLARGVGPMRWTEIDASGDARSVLRAALCELAIEE